MIRALVALALLVAAAGAARADDGDAFRAAAKLAADRDPRALDAFEALGAARPATRWTDDAWVEAARLAERAGDFARARKNLEHAIALGTELRDAQLVRRAKMDLTRLAEHAGDAGEWSAVATEHDRLVTAAASGGDPRRELVALEKLLAANEGYPRGVVARITLARMWEEEANVGRAIRWLRDAVRIARADARDLPRAALIRTLIRDRQLAAARTELGAIVNRGSRIALTRALDRAERLAIVRWGIAVTLVALLALGVVVLRRNAGSWREAARVLARPPIELVYFAPIGVVIGIVALTGNPLVGRAVVQIVIAGALIGWLSGATLEAARRTREVSRRRFVIHAAAAAAAVLAAVYLVIDHQRLIDLVADTWAHGPQRR